MILTNVGKSILQSIISTMNKIFEIRYVPFQINEKLNDVFKRVLEVGPQNVLWLCPTHRLLRERISRFAGYLKENSIAGQVLPDFQSLNDFAVRNFNFLNPDWNYLFPIQKTLLIEEAIFRANGKYVKGLANDSLMLISNLKEYVSNDVEVVKEKLVNALGDWEKNKFPKIDAGIFERISSRISQFIAIFEFYELAKKERKLFDETDAYYVDEIAYPAKTLIIIDSFQDLFPAQVNFLDRLEAGFSQVIKLTPEINPSARTLNEIFLHPSKIAVSVNKYLTPVQELEDVACKIRDLLKEGVRPEEVLVVVPDLSSVAKTIKSIFEEKNIEVNISTGHLILSSPVGGFLRGVSAFLEESRLSRPLLEIIFSQLFLIFWDKARDFEKVLAEVFKQDTFYDENTYPMQIIKKLKESGLNEAAQILEKIISIKKASTIKEAVGLIEELVVDIYKTFLKNDKSQEKDVEDILESIFLYKNSLLFEEEKDRPAEPKRISSLIYNLLSSPSKSYKGDVGQGVQITGILETRGMSADFIFFINLTDEAFPGRPSKVFIIPDEIKKALGIPASDEYLTKQKQDFYRILNSARYGVFLSSYEQEKNEVFLESRFLTELKALLKKEPSENIFLIESKLLEKQRSKKLVIDIFGRQDLDYAGEWEKERTRDSYEIKVGVETISKMAKCKMEFFLTARNSVPIMLPAEEPGVYILGNVYHRMASELINTLNKLQPQDEFNMETWVENWVQNNLKEGNFSKYDFLNYYGEKAMLSSLLSLGQNLKNLYDEELILITEVQHSKTFVHQQTGKKIKLVGRPDLVIESKNGEIKKVIDFKTSEKSKLDNFFKKQYEIQLYLYQFLLSSELELNQFKPGSSGFVWLINPFNQEIQEIIFNFKNDEEIRETINEAFELLVDNTFPEIEKCNSSICRFYYYCPAQR